jgi:HlyD family secretion protein
MARRKKKKKLKLFIFLVLVAGAGFVYWQVRQAGKATEDPAVPISLKKGAVVDRLTEIGKVEYETVVEVKSAISGRIKTLNVDEGQEVKLGDVMAVIEPDPEQAIQLSEKSVSVRRSRIIWKQKEKGCERVSELFKKDLVSKEQLEDAQDELNLAKHNYDLARLELKILEEEVRSVEAQPSEANPSDEEDGELTESDIRLQDFKVQAPIAGVVVQRKVEKGEMVIRGTSSFTQGTTLFRIGDPRKIIVSSLINEIDVPKLSIGMPVKIIPNADEQRTYRGQIEKIAPEGISIENIVNFRLEVVILNADSFLRQGMTCDVDVVLGEKEDVYYLPVEAILKVYKKDKEGKETKQIDKYTVYKKSKTDYSKTDVTVGLKSETRMEILSGLTPDDKVYPDAEKMAKKEKKEQEEQSRVLKKTATRVLRKHA